MAREKEMVETSQRAKAPAEEGQKARGFTFRSVVVAILWIVLVGWLNVRAEILSLSLPLPYDSAPSGVGLLIILIMLGLNGLLSQILLKKQFQFTRAEITVIYVMTMVGCILIGSGMISSLPGAMMTMNLPLSGVTYVPLNRWELVYENFYRLGVPMDEESAVAFWVGIERSNLEGVPWGQWLKMLPIWFIFLGSVYIMLLSVGTLLRRRWLEAEHLSFPLTTPVLTIASVGSKGDGKSPYAIKGNKLLWAGIIIGAFPLLWNWLAKFYLKGLPLIPLQYNLYELFTGARPPWNGLGAVGWHRLRIQSNLEPLLIGTCYFVPLNVLSSIVLAQLIAQIFKVITYAMGVIDMRGIYMFPIHFNAAGYLVVAGSSFWLFKGELKAMWRRAFKGQEELDDSEEGMSYRNAFLGFVVSAAIFVFMGIYFFRIPVVAIILFLILMVTGAVGFSRTRGLVGNPGYPVVFVEGNTKELLGATPTLGYTGMAGLGYLRLFEDGAQLMPTAWALEAYKLSDAVNVRRKDMTLGLIVAFVVAFVAGFLLILPPLYEWGAWNLRATSYGGNILRVDSVAYAAFHFPYHPTAGTGIHHMQVIITFAIGAFITLFLNVMQLKYVWWPLDALGFAVGNSPYWLQGRWINALIMLIAKGLIVRWGGRGALMNLTSLFIGIIIGAVFAPLIGGLISLVILPA